MEFIGAILAFLIFNPFVAICQAFAGILQPTRSPELIQVQRAAGLFLGLGVLAFAITFLGGYIGIGFGTRASASIVGVILVAVAGAIGHYIEAEVKKNQTAEDDATR
jgi:hypothetical protein